MYARTKSKKLGPFQTPRAPDPPRTSLREPTATRRVTVLYDTRTSQKRYAPACCFTGCLYPTTLTPSPPWRSGSTTLLKGLWTCGALLNPGVIVARLAQGSPLVRLTGRAHEGHRVSSRLNNAPHRMAHLAGGTISNATPPCPPTAKCQPSWSGIGLGLGLGLGPAVLLVRGRSLTMAMLTMAMLTITHRYVVVALGWQTH